MKYDRIEGNVVYLEPPVAKLYKCSFCLKSKPKKEILTNNMEGKELRNICTDCAIKFKEILNGTE